MDWVLWSSGYVRICDVAVVVRVYVGLSVLVCWLGVVVCMLLYMCVLLRYYLNRGRRI